MKGHIMHGGRGTGTRWYFSIIPGVEFFGSQRQQTSILDSARHY